MAFSRLLLAFTVSIAAFGPAVANPVSAKHSLANTVVLVIRHGEKPGEGDQLSPAGQARAKAYVKFFRDYTVDGQALHLDHIFATAKSKSSDRERLTAQPLADSLNLKIDDRFKNKEYADLATDIKGHDYGHELLIVWHHGNIPNLLTALGADPVKLISANKWPGDHFDWVVELHYDANGAVDMSKSKVVHEKLMPGDQP